MQRTMPNDDVGVVRGTIFQEIRPEPVSEPAISFKKSSKGGLPSNDSYLGHGFADRFSFSSVGQG